MLPSPSADPFTEAQTGAEGRDELVFSSFRTKALQERRHRKFERDVDIDMFRRMRESHVARIN